MYYNFGIISYVIYKSTSSIRRHPPDKRLSGSKKRMIYDAFYPKIINNNFYELPPVYVNCKEFISHSHIKLSAEIYVWRHSVFVLQQSAAGGSLTIMGVWLQISHLFYPLLLLSAAGNNWL